MHKLLGKPIVTSRYWRVDLFRDTSSESDVTFVIPWPLPAVIYTDDVNQYILVAYDQHDVATAIGKGIHDNPPFWRPPVHCKDAYPDTMDIFAGDFQFSVGSHDVTYSDREWRKVEKLLVYARGRDAYLELAKTSSYCTAVIGCKSDKCTHTLRVDKGDAISILPREGFAIVAVPLSPGAHVLEVSDNLFKGKGSITISCGKGDVVYLVTDSDRQFMNRGDCLIAGFTETYCSEVGVYDWTIKQIEKNIPEFLGARPLIIWRGGKWILNPESENLDTFSGQ